MLQQLETLYNEALGALESVSDAQALNNWENKFIGRKGEITLLLRSVGQLPKDQRADFGKRANEIKDDLGTRYTQREALIRQRELAQNLEEGEIDVTRPGRPTPVDGLHPDTQALREINRIWPDMGVRLLRSR